MDILEAHGKLALVERDERDQLLPDAGQVMTPEGPVDIWPAVATALAELSGGLSDAATDADLAAAVQHGLSLWNGKMPSSTGGLIVSDDDVFAEIDAVIAAVDEWGEENEMAFSTPWPSIN